MSKAFFAPDRLHELRRFHKAQQINPHQTGKIICLHIFKPAINEHTSIANKPAGAMFCDNL